MTPYRPWHSWTYWLGMAVWAAGLALVAWWWGG